MTAGHAPRSEVPFDLRFDLRMHPSRDAARSRQYSAALAMMAESDAHGARSIILSEHHGAEDGYLPSCITSAAAAAGRTRRARIALSALILPMLEPVHTAEQVLVLDQISDGRVDVIVGLGYVRSEYAMFGLEATNRVALLEAKLPVFSELLTGRPVIVDGRVVRVTPGPVQSPRPKVLLAASVPAAARRAARLADGVHCPVARHQIEPHYRAERQRLGLEGGLVEGGIGAAGSLYVADDPERAWAELGPYLLHEINAYGRWAMDNNANQHLYQPTDDIAVARQLGMHVILTPDDAVEYVAVAGESGVILNPLAGGTPPEVAERYLGAFLDDVLPRAGGRVAGPSGAP